MLSAIIYIAVMLVPLAIIAIAISVGRSKPGSSGQRPFTSATSPIRPPEFVAPPPPPLPQAHYSHPAPSPVAPPAHSKAALPLPPVEGEETEEVTYETLMVSSVVPRLRETSALGSANRVINLKTQIVTMGRAKDNDIVLKEDAASGHHCRLEKHGVSYRLVDLNSTNKTWVNGAEKQNVVLRNSDQIKVGDTTFIFELFGDRS